MHAVVGEIHVHRGFSPKFQHLNLPPVHERPDSNLVAFQHARYFSIQRNRREAHFLVHGNLRFQLRFGSDCSQRNSQGNSGENKSSKGNPAAFRHSRSRHSSKFTAACIVLGSPVSTTGRTSSRLVISGSRGKFLSGPPSTTESVAKQSWVTRVLCPGAVA